MITRNQDFAENGSIKNKRQVQSQYWITISYTLFISCVTWVVSAEWNKEAGKLKVGDEVTVFGEKSGEPIAMHSFWGIVTSIVDAEAEVYEVTDKNGNLHRPARKELRHRQNHNIVFGHVSDDKSHDSYAMQHFTTNELEDLEGYMLENFPADIPTGKIQCLHSKSDNAASHFKSRKSMNYFSRLIKDRGGPSQCAYVYSYGAPHHGKGKWDGAGRCMKHKVDQDTSSAMTMGSLSHTASGGIENCNDVYDSLVHHFQHGEHRYRKKKANGFNAWRFRLYTAQNNPVMRPDEIFTALKDISSSYQFVIRNEGLFYTRKRVCYCLHCIASMRMGFTEWNGQTHNILCCSMVSLGQDAVQQNVYTFNQQSCERISGPNVSRQIQEDRRNRTEMALSLNIGDWVLFNSKMEDEPIWLGRVMSNPVWEGMCISQNNTRTKKTFDNGVEIGANEVAILVQWYEKIDLNASVLKYRVSKTINIPQVQNNFYLVYAGFEMSEMNGRTNIVPKLRSAARMKENWHNKESKFVWEMDVNVRLEALSKCGVDK